MNTDSASPSTCLHLSEPGSLHLHMGQNVAPAQTRATQEKPIQFPHSLKVT